MGMKHEAKKGTVIRAGGVTITVLRGNPQLEITTDEPDVVITTTAPESGQPDSLDQVTQTAP